MNSFEDSLSFNYFLWWLPYRFSFHFRFLNFTNRLFTWCLSHYFFIDSQYLLIRLGCLYRLDLVLLNWFLPPILLVIILKRVFIFLQFHYRSMLWFYNDYSYMSQNQWNKDRIRKLMVDRKTYKELQPVLIEVANKNQ